MKQQRRKGVQRRRRLEEFDPQGRSPLLQDPQEDRYPVRSAPSPSPARVDLPPDPRSVEQLRLAQESSRRRLQEIGAGAAVIAAAVALRLPGMGRLDRLEFLRQAWEKLRVLFREEEVAEALGVGVQSATARSAAWSRSPLPLRRGLKAGARIKQAVKRARRGGDQGRRRPRRSPRKRAR